jgi:MYXO-CTERM domain-containing protein
MRFEKGILMKRFFRLKTARTALLVSTLALVGVMPGTAQTPTGGSSPGDNSAGYQAGRTDRRDDGTDWGWLGLLGLTGLLGLIPKKRRAEVDYRTTDTESRAPAR